MEIPVQSSTAARQQRQMTTHEPDDASPLTRTYYSQRTGSNPRPDGLPFAEILNLFARVYDELKSEGYFNEAFGYSCVDLGEIPGRVRDVSMEILLAVRKKKLWPIAECSQQYSADDFFDVIEFLFQHVSKPIDGEYHSYAECGMHWETFSRQEGRENFRRRINQILQHYERRFELSRHGQILHCVEAGFEPIFDADVPSDDANIVSRIDAAVLAYRRHGSTVEERRHAVRDLVDVLEYLRPQVKAFLTKKDDGDLFNLANNFGVRHHNDKQKTEYDAALWLSWMFYFYLATIHVVLRKMRHGENS